MDERTSALRELMNVGRQLVTERDPDAVLQRLVEEARRVTGARYGALGVLNRQRTELERFIHSGVDETTRRTIGELPRGRGVLGVLIENPEPLRLEHVGDHIESFGFPVGHPEMQSFLGVPILVAGRAWGNLYLTEKAGDAAFSEEDEEAVTILAEWAATAIENARAYQESERRRIELERAVRGLDAARNIADAISAESDLDRILELIVKRGRALIDARSVIITLVEGDDLVIAACAGQVDDMRGRRVPMAESTTGEVLLEGYPRRVRDASVNMKVAPEYMGARTARHALLVPMIHRGERIGVLTAFDRGDTREAFSAADAGLLRTFATSAASAVAISRSVEADRLRSTIAAAEAERRRWARELHDETLQALGALRVLLASALRRGDHEYTGRAVRQAVEDIETEIENLRAIISELRPRLLDDLGLGAAIEALVDRRRASGLEITVELALDGPEAGAPTAELETTLYRLVQEALTNVVKHAEAQRVEVLVRVGALLAEVRVRDDGRGFDPTATTQGFGLSGIRERVLLSRGSLTITAAPGEGTEVAAALPLSGRELLADEPTPAGGLAHGMSEI
ncbi:MAG TPA: GAF domain-containing sensor histidine kinase [Solirubrobacteraceae bacterium]|nr:GAF domain-containing sensor histidine kinase [Solirubrobacteraceae bacterium]